MKKLKNILLATTLSMSFGLNKSYSQAAPKMPLKQIDYGDYYYCLNGKSYHKLWSKWSDGQIRTDDIRTPQNDSECQENKITQDNTNTNKNSNLSKITQKEWENVYDKNSNKQNKLATNYNYATSKTNKSKTNLGDALNTTQNVLNTAVVIGGTALILDAILKPRKKKIIYTEPSKNNSPNNYDFKPKNSEGDWQDKKFGEVKKVDENFWEENAQKKAESKKIANERSKELSDFVEKQIEYSPETKKWFNEEVKKADEFYKEFYRTDSKAYAEAQKLDDLHKVISYNAYQKVKSKNPSGAGKVLEGMEIYNELEEKGVKKFYEDEMKEANEFAKEREKIDGKWSEYTKNQTDLQKLVSYESLKAVQYLPGVEKAMDVTEKVGEFRKEKTGKEWWDK